MEVILLESIANLGDLGDKVNVRSGYGRNFLIPQKKAVPATAANVAEFEARRAELEKAEAEKLGEAQARAAEIAAISVSIATKAGDEGKLFGSITVRDIAAACEAKGVAIENSEIRLPEGPIRELGSFEIDIHLHTDVDAVLKLEVVAES